jgi:hypothetical protein
MARPRGQRGSYQAVAMTGDAGVADKSLLGRHGGVANSRKVAKHAPAEAGQGEPPGPTDPG